MKTIGLIGGTSWSSTIVYYQLINKAVSEIYGHEYSARVVLSSMNLKDVLEPMTRDDWKAVTDLLISHAIKLESAGADFILICSNTLHKVKEDVAKEVSLPILDILDVLTRNIKQNNYKTIGLLGSLSTMNDLFYKNRLSSIGVSVITPDLSEQKLVDDIIFNELTSNKINVDSKKCYKGIMDSLIKQGAEAIILGCTEIQLLVRQQDVNYPLIDTTTIHSLAAVRKSLEGAKVTRKK